MGEAGVLAPDARVELIEREIIDMAPIGAGRAYVVNELTRLLAEAVRGRPCWRSSRLYFWGHARNRNPI